jgi:FG-GAP repeat
MKSAHVALVVAILATSLRALPPQNGSIVTLEGSFTQNVTAFGTRTAIDGQTALIGCRLGQGSGTNSVFFYDRTPTGWAFTQQFSGVSLYSTSVDISGDRAVVGAPYISGELMYIYERTAGVWSQKQIINGFVDGHDWFGTAVAIDGDWAACTAPESLQWNGPIHLYQRGATNWIASDVLSDDNGAGAGDSLDISLPRLIVGDTEWEGQGAAQVWMIPALGGSGLVEAELVAPDPSLGNEEFGSSVAIQGDRVVVGAHYHWHLGVAFTGGAYVFERNGTSWNLVTELVATPLIASEQLGRSVALDGDRIMVGGKNVAYLFERIGGTWTQTARLVPAGALANFGAGVALDGTHALVGMRDAKTVFAYELTPAPAVYCTAKTNSQGCVPAIAYSGSPSATLAQPFAISVSQVINNKTGTLYYGVNGQLAAPFQGGTQCVAGPRVRTPLQLSGGNPPPDDCSGLFTYDFNARIQSGVDASLVAGAIVDAQYWMRDGAASFQTGLSDALQLTIAP